MEKRIQGLEAMVRSLSRKLAEWEAIFEETQAAMSRVMEVLAAELDDVRAWITHSQPIERDENPTPKEH